MVRYCKANVVFRGQWYLKNFSGGSDINFLSMEYQVLDNLPHDLVYSPDQVSPWMEVWIEKVNGRFVTFVFLTLIRQPGARSYCLRRVRPLWVFCTQHFPAFLQEAVSKSLWNYDFCYVLPLMKIFAMYCHWWRLKHLFWLLHSFFLCAMLRSVENLTLRETWWNKHACSLLISNKSFDQTI
jgi:hypothetical protein